MNIPSSLQVLITDFFPFHLYFAIHISLEQVLKIFGYKYMEVKNSMYLLLNCYFVIGENISNDDDMGSDLLCIST